VTDTVLNKLVCFIISNIKRIIVSLGILTINIIMIQKRNKFFGVFFKVNIIK